MSDEFSLLVAKVRDKQQEYSDLEKSVVTLLATQKELKVEVDTANRAVVNAQARAEEIKSSTEHRQKAFDELVQTKESALEADRQAFERIQDSQTTDLAAKLNEYEENQRKLKRSQENLANLETELEQQKSNLNDLRVSLERWAKDLGAKEQKVKASEQASEELRENLSTLASELYNRDIELKSKEKTVQEALQEATDDKNAASLLLETSKDKVAELDLKEKALIKRDLLLDGREAELNKKAIRLADREQVMDTHNI